MISARATTPQTQRWPITTQPPKTLIIAKLEITRTISFDFFFSSFATWEADMAIRGPVGLFPRPFPAVASIVEATLRFRRPFDADILVYQPTCSSNCTLHSVLLLGFSFCIVHQRSGSWIGLGNAYSLALQFINASIPDSSAHHLFFRRGVSSFSLWMDWHDLKIVSSTCNAGKSYLCYVLPRIGRVIVHVQNFKPIARSRDSEGVCLHPRDCHRFDTGDDLDFFHDPITVIRSLDVGGLISRDEREELVHHILQSQS